MNEYFIPVLLGTAREDRQSAKVATFLSKQIATVSGVRTELVDVGSMKYTATVPPWGKGGANEVKTDWQRTMKDAHGLLIVVPEYNHGYPGELKLVLDSLYDEYAGKPVALCGVSAGGLGGARVVEHIKPVLTELHMIIVPNALYVSRVKEAFDEQGNPTDATLAERADKLFNELLGYAKKLR